MTTRLELLKATEEHWLDNQVAGVLNADTSGDACPLCNKYRIHTHPAMDCFGCPVEQYTKAKYCKFSAYYKVCHAKRMKDQIAFDEAVQDILGLISVLIIRETMEKENDAK